MCARIGACENTLANNQSRPVLTGLSGQKYYNVNADGTCKYGHDAKEGKCEPGWNCGYTFYECACVDEDTAADGLKEDQTVKLVGGAGLFVVGIGAIAAIVAVEQNRVNKARSAPKVVPYSLDLERNGQKSASPAFSGVGPNAPAPAPPKAIAPGLAGSKQFQIDGLGLGCMALLGVVALGGIIIVAVTISDKPEGYYNGCGTRE